MSFMTDGLFPLTILFISYFGLKFGWEWQRMREDNRPKVAHKMFQDIFSGSAYQRTICLISPLLGKAIVFLFINKKYEDDEFGRLSITLIARTVVVFLAFFLIGHQQRGFDPFGSFSGTDYLDFIIITTIAAISSGAVIASFHSTCIDIEENFDIQTEREGFDYIYLPLLVLIVGGLSILQGVNFNILDLTESTLAIVCMLILITVSIVIPFIEYTIDWLAIDPPDFSV